MTLRKGVIYFDDKWYMSMVYDFFYDLKMDEDDDV
jgi:hypothetical protein